MSDDAALCLYCWEEITDEEPVEVRDEHDLFIGVAHANCLKDAQECAKENA